jgi:hypothetical protein
MPEEMTLLVALKKHIGYSPGQGFGEFAAECKALTDEDKAWFKDRFKVEMDIDIVAAKKTN